MAEETNAESQTTESVDNKVSVEVESVDSLLSDKSSRKQLAFEISNDEFRYQSVKTLNKLCTHSSDGYEKTIEILDQYTTSNQTISKYQFIVVTLQLLLQVSNATNSNSSKATDKEDYILELIKLVNNLVSGCQELHDRIRIRSELITLKLTDLFKTVVKNYSGNESINEQISMFVKLRNQDECAGNDVDLNNHFDIFSAICTSVLETQNEGMFLATLRHLLKIDNSTKLSKFVWEVIEKLVCRATLLDREEHTLSDALERYTEEKFNNLTTKPPPPPPAPPLPSTVPAPPPPPPPFSDTIFTGCANFSEELKNRSFQSEANKAIRQKAGADECTNNNNNADKSTTALDNNKPNGPQAKAVIAIIEEKLPQQCVPKAQTKMKQFIWSKIQQDRIVGKQSIWTKFKSNYSTNEFCTSESNDNSDRDEGFFQEIEDFFRTSENPRAESQYKDPNLKETKIWHSSEKINLLESKRSLNINIYLKQFRCSPEEIVDLLSKNENKQLGLENLEGMLKILPDANEIDLLKMYQGDINKLGEAEKFLFQLIQVENYMLRIESLLLKEEFSGQMIYFNKYFENIFKASELIYNSSSLANIMLHICRTGNFINDGNFSGNAAGFKLSSLIKLADLKSNKHNVTLLHVILQQLEEVNSPLVHLPKELISLRDVSSLQLDNFKNEISTFCARVKRLNEQIEAVDDSQLSNLKEFIQTACGAIHLLEKRQADLSGWKTKLAEYFCEDTTYFKLEECFSTLFKFCDRIKKCLQQNQERRCSELKRSSSIRGSRRFLGSSCDAPTQTNGTNNNNVKTAQHGNNRRISSSIGRYSMVIENQINDLVDSTPEFQSFSAVSNQNLLADDLDNELASGSFFRRSTRLSRKSSVNKVIPGFDEQNRELLNSRSSFRNFFKDNQEKTIIPTLDTSTTEPGTETTTIAKEDKKSTDDGTESEYVVPTVVLRRSQSTSEYENTGHYKPLFRSRREIPTLGLSEEDSDGQQVKLRNQSKSSNRLSGLKKLGSLYKTFEDDDINKSHQRKTSSSVSNQFEENLSFSVEEKGTVDAAKESEVTSHFMSSGLVETPSESARVSSLESRRVLFEANKKAAQEKQAISAAVLSANSGYNEKLPTQLQSSAFNRSSKLRHTVHQNASNLVTNRIIKFESRNEIAQKYLGTEDPVLAGKPNNTDSGLVGMKRISSVRIESLASAPAAESNTSTGAITTDADYVNKLKKEKVKSLSKNWEQITESKSKSQPIKMVNSFGFASPSTNIGEKIEKFNSNNLIQLISKQPSNEALRPGKKNRNNSGCTTNSEDNENSKDDGFETQSNASSSQNSDSNLMTNKSISENSHKLAAYLAYTNNCSFLPDADSPDQLHSVSAEPEKSSANSTVISDESMSDSNSPRKSNENIENDPNKKSSIEKCSTSRTSKSLKQIKQSKSSTSKQQQSANSSSTSSSSCSSPVLTSSPRGKAVFRPVSTVTVTSSCHTPPLQKKIMQGGSGSSSSQSISINKKTVSSTNLSSLSHGQRNNICGSTKNNSITNSNLSLNDSFSKTQRGSMLYLNDTASTKAKKSETKNRESVGSMSRANSLRKKTSVLASSSTISLPNKDNVIEGRTSSVFERLAKKDSPRKV